MKVGKDHALNRCGRSTPFKYQFDAFNFNPTLRPSSTPWHSNGTPMALQVFRISLARTQPRSQQWVARPASLRPAARCHRITGSRVRDPVHNRFLCLGALVLSYTYRFLSLIFCISAAKNYKITFPVFLVAANSHSFWFLSKLSQACTVSFASSSAIWQPEGRQSSYATSFFTAGCEVVEIWGLQHFATDWGGLQ